jgi:hypothetical protein
MYYAIEYKYDSKWLMFDRILEGDIHKHLVAIETLKKATPGVDFRLKRIAPKEAGILLLNGFELWVAPKKLKNVQDTPTTD